MAQAMCRQSSTIQCSTALHSTTVDSHRRDNSDSVAQLVSTHTGRAQEPVRGRDHGLRSIVPTDLSKLRSSAGAISGEGGTRLAAFHEDSRLIQCRDWRSAAAHDQPVLSVPCDTSLPEDVGESAAYKNFTKSLSKTGMRCLLLSSGMESQMLVPLMHWFVKALGTTSWKRCYCMVVTPRALSLKRSRWYHMSTDGCRVWFVVYFDGELDLGHRQPGSHHVILTQGSLLYLKRHLCSACSIMAVQTVQAESTICTVTHWL